MKAPCKDCDERYAGCHAKCERYKAFDTANKERLDKKRRTLDAENDITAYSIDAQRNMKRKKW